MDLGNIPPLRNGGGLLQQEFGEQGNPTRNMSQNFYEKYEESDRANILQTL